jgi:hypothetical protein
MSIEKSKTIPYSAKNKRTNPLAPYSTLKPEMSSLSPSLKSKGARLVSATQLNQNIKKINKDRNILEKDPYVELVIEEINKKKKISAIS